MKAWLVALLVAAAALAFLPAVLSQSCSVDIDCDEDDKHFCNHTTNSCAERQSQGANCTRDAECSKKYRCFNGTCTRPLDDRANCESDHQCPGSCVDGECILWRYQGAYCDTSAQCLSGVCNARVCLYYYPRWARILFGVLVPVGVIIFLIPIASSVLLNWGIFAMKESNRGTSVSQPPGGTL